MKNAQKSDTYEPTISDVMGVVQGLATNVQVLTTNLQDLTEAVQTGFAKVEERFDRHEHILTSLVEGQQNLREILNERTTVIDSRLSKVQNRVEDIADIIEIDHERRIARLEKALV